MGHKGNAAPALGGQGRRVHGTAVEPDAPAHERVGLEQAQHRVGQKRLARARGAHHGDDLPLVHGKAQGADDLHFPLGHVQIAPQPSPICARIPLRPRRRRFFIVHEKRHGEVLHRQQVMAVPVARRGRVGVVMMHRLSTVIDGLVGDGRLLFHTPLLFLGVGRIDELAQARSHHIEQHDATTSASPGNTASHHSPADR